MPKKMTPKLAKQTKYTLLYIVTAIFLLLCFFLISNNDQFYNKDILKITNVTLFDKNEVTGVNQQSEFYYTQEITGILTNGEKKGEQLTFTTTASQSQMKYPIYKKGAKLFVTLEDQENGTITATITGQKRDQYLFLFLSIFAFALFIVSGKRTKFTVISLIINLVIFYFCLKFCDTDIFFQWLWTILVLLFTVITLVLSSGLHKKTFGAIISTLASTLFIGLLYYVTVYVEDRLPYGQMEYVYRQLPFANIYMVSLLLGCLGAIMDVSIVINATISEMLTINPTLTIKSLIHSLREIGYDIMGTMINILFFSYLSSSLPLAILKLHSGYSLGLTMSTTYVFDIVRFLIGSIGIVITIPIAGFIAILLFKKGGQKP